MVLKLFERYIGAAMLKATGMTLVVLVVLLVFFGLIDEMDEVGKGDYRMGDAFLVAMLSAPRYVFEAFPVAALIGSLIGLGSMAGHSELIAMRGAGFSLLQIILAVMKTGLLMIVLVVLFGEFVAPRAEQWGEQHRTEKISGKVTLKTRYGFWARDGKAFVNIRDILPGSRLREIFIYEFDESRRLTLATRARRAEYQGTHWLMFDVRQSRISEDGVTTHRMEQTRWDSLVDPALLSAIVIQPTMLPLSRLFHFIQIMRENGQSATDYEVAFWSKLATPLATLVMLFIAIPFVLGHQRFVSMGQRVFLGVVLGMAFYMFNQGMSYVAIVYEFNPMLSAAIPATAFLAIAMLMMRRVR